RDAALEALSGGTGRSAAPTVTVLRPGDPALVPDAGHESVTLTAAVPARGGDPAALAEELITVAGRAIPDLRERLLWHQVHTPADIAEETGAEDGAVPPPALAADGGRRLHPANSTR